MGLGYVGVRGVIVAGEPMCRARHIAAMDSRFGCDQRRRAPVAPLRTVASAHR